MTEVPLFIIVGGISVAAAVLMLLSENAVHSALFLILNLVSVAFLYLLLEAPFLAMVQIAVYAGAIMVLFLFVIMLLGAEKLGGESASADKYHWMTPAGLFLAVAFLVAAGAGIIEGDIELQSTPADEPLMRIAYVAADGAAVDVYLDGNLLLADVSFGEATAFTEVLPGSHAVRLNSPGTNDVLLQAQVENELGDVQTVVAFGEGDALSLGVVAEDIETVERGNARFSVFNAYEAGEAVALIDFGPNRTLDRDATTDEITDEALVAGLATGETSELFLYEEGRADWAFVSADDGTTLFTIRAFDVQRDFSRLLILTGERLFDGSMRAVAVPLEVPTRSTFGGPTSIGEVLFDSYLLPFELVSVLLLVAMVGAIVLTQGVRTPLADRKRPERRRVSQSLSNAIAAQTGQQIESASATEQPEVAGD